MLRVCGVGLLVLATLAMGCETGSTRQNVSTTGATGQNVGKDSNRTDGPVPGSTTGTEGNIQEQPAQQEHQSVPDTSGQKPPR